MENYVPARKFILFIVFILYLMKWSLVIRDYYVDKFLRYIYLGCNIRTVEKEVILKNNQIFKLDYF